MLSLGVISVIAYNMEIRPYGRESLSPNRSCSEETELIVVENVIAELKETVGN